jgi:hypothetical protein
VGLVLGILRRCSLDELEDEAKVLYFARTTAEQAPKARIDPDIRRLVVEHSFKTMAAETIDEVALFISKHVEDRLFSEGNLLPQVIKILNDYKPEHNPETF